MVSDTLTVADIRAVAAFLDAASVPTIGGCYQVHIHPRQAADLRHDAIDSRLRPARHFASWAAYANESMRMRLRVGEIFEYFGSQSTVDEDDIDDALLRMGKRWKQVARQRRAKTIARKGWV
jgi:hypothetical protein